MNRILFSNAFLTFVLIASVSYAQDAAAPADKESQSAAAEQIPDMTPPAPVASPTVSVPGEDPTAKVLREGAPLRVRQEQAFDVNGNNRLEPAEIREFFKSVYQEAARGSVKNTSDLLYPFDRNKDGYIDRSEASSLPR